METVNKSDVEKILHKLWKEDNGQPSENRVAFNEALQKVQIELDALEVIDPYEQCVQYDSIKTGIQAHAETYSFNIESELFNQLTKEQQALWRKEIEQACISGGEAGVELARDHRYKENNEIKLIFNVGDWVVNKLGDAWHIDSFDRKNYQVSDGKGNYNYFPISKQNKMHLWSIEDAKDGDILSVEPVGGYQFPFVAIYKNRGLDFFNSYCFIGLDGKFYEADTGHALDEIHPATKEQRNILFSKMKEAGYDWNGEKKELKRIESKTV